MRVVLRMAGKDLRLLSRDRFALFWMFAFPLMYALFFGSLFGGDGGGAKSAIAVAIVDDAGNAASAALIERLQAHRSLDARARGDAAPDAPAAAADALLVVPLERARELVRKGRRAAYVRIPAGYEASPLRLFGGGGGDDDAMTIEVGIDPSRATEAGFLQGILMESLFSGLGAQFTDRATMQREVARSLEELRGAGGGLGPQRQVLETFLNALDRFVSDADFAALGGDGAATGGGGLDLGAIVRTVDVARERGDSPRSAYEVMFPAAMLWGLMSVALGFAVTMVRERTQGTMLRLRTAPITRTQLLAGKAAGCFAMCLIVMSTLLLIGSLLLGVRVQSAALLAVAMACTGVCFTGLMMLVSVLGKTEPAVAGASWGLMMPFAMVGGGMIPLVAMPQWLQRLSDFSPFKWGIYAVEGAVWRGFDASDLVLPGLILVGLGAAFFAVGVIVLRRTD